MMDQLLAFLTGFTQPQLLLLVGLGTFAGVYLGAIPGLSVTMAVSILISFTFSWDVFPAISLMIGIYMGGVYGGSRTAIPLNIPGAPSAIATALDGYPMAKRGEAGTAIGVTTVMSFFGGFVGIIVLAVGGAFIPMMTIGIPGDAVTAIMIGALFIHGLNPGPTLMIDKPDMFWLIVGALVVANVFMLIFLSQTPLWGAAKRRLFGQPEGAGE
jgi:putative tricarboxylic transport membrane protein